MGSYRRQTVSRLMPGRWHDVAYWGLLLVACAVFYWMNVLTPYKEDDMGFTLIDGVWTRVNSLADAWQSYCNHLANTNRRLADIIPTLFAGLLGKGAFNVCNTLIFGLLAHLLSLLCVHRRSVTVLAMFFAVVGTCYPVPGETMLWMAGSANYMWAVTLSLGIIYFLERHHNQSLGLGQGTLLLLGAIVAGGFNEATSFGFFAGLVLYYIFNHRQLDRRAVIVLAGYLIGILLIASSPAAWSRAAEEGIILGKSINQLFTSRWHIFIEKSWRFYLPIGALLVGIIALIMKRGRNVRKNVWTYVFLGLTLVMFMLGILHERAYFPWITVAFIILAIGVDYILSQALWLRLAVILISGVLAVFTFGRGIKVATISLPTRLSIVPIFTRRTCSSSAIRSMCGIMRDACLTVLPPLCPIATDLNLLVPFTPLKARITWRSSSIAQPCRTRSRRLEPIPHRQKTKPLTKLRQKNARNTASILTTSPSDSIPLNIRGNATLSAANLTRRSTRLSFP